MGPGAEGVEHSQEPVYSDGGQGEGGHEYGEGHTWNCEFAHLSSKKQPTVKEFRGCEDTHDDVWCCEVEEVEVDGGPHVFVEEDDANHQEVAPNTNNEDTGIQAEEDYLNPVIIKVELLVAAHLFSDFVLNNLIR